ncbi:MAG: PilT/PilU family type 4a pilus ATPase [Phycisphaerales bacterium]
MSNDKITMWKLLYNMRKTDASDLHIKVGQPPVFRIGGELRSPQGMNPLSVDDTKRLISEILPPQMRHKFEETGDVDFSTFQDHEPGHDPNDTMTPEGDRKRDRFRCNVFRAGGGMHAAIRRVKPEIPSFQELGLPPVYQRIVDQTAEGLILVVGITGSGKSTTLACMLDRINATKGVNIVTIEDPVEFQLHPKKAIISQRELGTDVESYGKALKYVVRQDPDVIFIGELRDHDTVMAAVQAAETGHLVFGSLHSADTMQCFGRMIEFFPQNEHAFIRSALANTIKAVFAQRLLPAQAETAGAPVVPAFEVLLANGSVREAIRDGEDSNLPTMINAAASDGMISFTACLAKLVEEEKITMSTALEFAPNREALQSRIKGVEVRASTLVGKK